MFQCRAERKFTKMEATGTIQGQLNRNDILRMLSLRGKEQKELFNTAAGICINTFGSKVYFRGLIEFSNICSKNCFYCGIRKGNTLVERYNLSDEQIMEAALFAYKQGYGSIVLQGGEIRSAAFTIRIENLLKRIKELTGEGFGITLSLGEQSYETYEKWRLAGAHRYLLRIESSDRRLYQEIHPDDEHHEFDTRLNCLHSIKLLGYQAGTGVMVGLPSQSVDQLADDLLFIREMDVDMVGMGPYIEHPDTPLHMARKQLLPKKERLRLTLNMIAAVRILMPDINIAATTALQAIDPFGRERAIMAGANVLMPNVTPGLYRNAYSLYENKPCADEDPDDCRECLDARISLIDRSVAYNEKGDSIRYLRRNRSK